MSTAQAMASLLALLTFIVWEVCRQYYVALLRHHNPGLWNALGSPRGIVSRLFFNEGISVERHILRRDFLTVTNVEISRAGSRIYFALLAFLIAAVTWLIMCTYSVFAYFSSVA